MQNKNKDITQHYFIIFLDVFQIYFYLKCNFWYLYIFFPLSRRFLFSFSKCNISFKLKLTVLGLKIEYYAFSEANLSLLEVK